MNIKSEIDNIKLLLVCRNFECKKSIYVETGEILILTRKQFKEQGYSVTCDCGYEMSLK